MVQGLSASKGKGTIFLLSRLIQPWLDAGMLPQLCRRSATEKQLRGRSSVLELALSPQVWSPLSPALPPLHQEICVCLCLVAWQMQHHSWCDFFPLFFPLSAECYVEIYWTFEAPEHRSANCNSWRIIAVASQPPKLHILLLCDETRLSAAPSPRLSNKATAASSFRLAPLSTVP